jgi:hypothetical protein
MPTGRSCLLKHREDEFGCQHPEYKRILGVPNPSLPNTPIILPPSNFNTLCDILVKKNDEKKRKELTAKLKVYREDGKIKVKSDILINLG